MDTGIHIETNQKSRNSKIVRAAFRLFQIDWNEQKENTNRWSKEIELRYYVHYIYLSHINMYEDTYPYCRLISIQFLSLYITIIKIDSMVERVIYESFYYEPFYHTIGSHRLLLILVRSFHLRLRREIGIFFLKSLIRTKKLSFIQINHFDWPFLRIL